jgi:hypothetical protein
LPVNVTGAGTALLGQVSAFAIALNDATFNPLVGNQSVNPNGNFYPGPLNPTASSIE